MTEIRRLVHSPVGPILLSADAWGRLTGAHFGADPGAAAPHHPDGTAEAGRRVLDATEAQLGEYFEGRRTCFEIPLAMRGSAFQRRVWAQLQQIPFGSTTSYGQLALHIGHPGAARAVGHANARNPIAVIVPCHRVIGSSGGLTGYGGGLTTKQHLLDLEARGGASARNSPRIVGAVRTATTEVEARRPAR